MVFGWGTSSVSSEESNPVETNATSLKDHDTLRGNTDEEIISTAEDIILSLKCEKEIKRVLECKEASNVALDLENIGNTCKNETEQFYSCVERSGESVQQDLLEFSISSCPKEYQIAIDCNLAENNTCVQKNIDVITCGAKKIIEKTTIHYH